MYNLQDKGMITYLKGFVNTAIGLLVHLSASKRSNFHLPDVVFCKGVILADLFHAQHYYSS